jgi:hypothetical protein
MAEKVVSPGVFTNEIDQSFLPAAIGEIGGAIIGPTVKGPALTPTVVTSYSEYQNLFGDSFKSGSSYYTYLTSLTARNYLKHAPSLTVVRILDGTYSHATANIPTGSGLLNSDSYNNPALKLHTLSHGSLQNTTTGSGGRTGFSSPYTGNNAILTSGSQHNLRWEVTTRNTAKGTFTLLIRRGDDTDKRKVILETWNNVSMDANSTNYVGRVIGDQVLDIKGRGTGTPYLQPSGSYPVKSKYVRVEVTRGVVDYLDENGTISKPLQNGASVSASLPGISSGSFSGGTDGFIGYDALGAQTRMQNTIPNFYKDISSGNTQGYILNAANSSSTAYGDAIDLLSNQDEYDINLLMMPGVLSGETNHSAIASKAIDMVEGRGDCFLLLDSKPFGTALTSVTSEADARDSNYAATYWPWIQVQEPQTAQMVWVPPSAVIPGVLAFNDKVAHEWFAPAGLNRGGIENAIQAERKLTQANRDTLYESNVNPIATFPGQGVCVWGQKTLQKKASALDRVNVRRLLIRLKKFIASSSRFLVFEQNNGKTRARFLGIVNPFLESVQSNSGLSAFRIVMDDTNNTPDVVDRNILYGQIFVQPTRTAEFIVLDFTIQPTGATFPE